MNKEKINTIQEEARGIFNLLQRLQAPMNENNIAVLNASLCSLKLIQQICEEAKKGAEEDGDKADTE